MTDTLVLTAQHVWRGEPEQPVGVRVQIRFADETRWRDADEAWVSANELDACLLRLRAPRTPQGKLAWGEHDRSADVSYESCGYPLASRVEDELAESYLRETAGVRGKVLRHGGLTQGLCELTAEEAPIEAERWRGLSGAPVFVDGCLIAVICSGPRDYAGQRLWAAPVAWLLEDEEFAALVGRPRLRWVPRSVLVPGSRELPRIIGPAALLGAPYGVVPFFEASRTRELDWLQAWVTREQPFGVHLFIGPGGAGKTRLFIEWCQRLSMQRGPDGKRWEAGFLPEDADEAQLAGLLARKLPLFVVIDYAETRPRLGDVLRQLVHADGVVRVALLARNAGDWWRALGNSGDVLRDVVTKSGITELSPVGLAGELRKHAFEEAYWAFARQRGKPEEPPGAAALEDAQFERMLYIHLAALAALEGVEVSAEGLLHWVIEREQRVWKRWEGAPAGDHAQAMFVQQARRAVAALTLVGGAPGLEEAGEVLQRANGPGDRTLFAYFLRQLYPGREPTGARAAYVSGLEPDLLGEVLVAQVLADANTPAQYLDRVFAAADPAALRSGFTVLGRIALAGRDPHVEDWLARLLDADVLGRAEAALDVALSLGRESAFAPLGRVLETSLRRAGNAGIARRLEGKLPEHTVSLRELAVWVYEMLVHEMPDPAADEDARAERARLLHNLGVWYGALGQREAALATTGEAVELRRKLSEQQPDAFLPDLTKSLNNLGAIYSELRHREAALAVTREAVAHCRKLSEQQPDAFLPDLAASLDNLGVAHRELGQPEAALAATREAVELRRKLSEQQPDAFLPDLAGGLDNLSVWYSELGQLEAALSASREAVELRRKLSEQQPDAFLSGLAGSLNNLGIWYSQLEQLEAALSASREAVEHYRKLSEKRPGAFLPDLARSLQNLSVTHRELGQLGAALSASREAVEHYRKLSEELPGVFLPDLAGSFNNLGVMHLELGQREAALTAFCEAVEHYRKLSEELLDTSLPNLAMSLYNLSIMYDELSRPQEALAAAEEAVTYYNKFAQARPAVFTDDLAASVHRLARCLHALGRDPDSHPLFQTASALLQSLRPE